MISDFADAVAVGSLSKAYIFFTQRSKSPICVSLPQDEADLTALPTDAVNVAWTLDPKSPFEPLLIFSCLNLLYIYNVNRKGICSYLRGHGGAITAIAVHPVTVNLFCTTSRDYSTRIYDLTLPPQDGPSNPHWPPGREGSRAGAAHGLHMTEAEGSGNGRCIIVLMGGRSGGHQAAVLGAAFHPQLPVIATCGLDRTVKIWFVPPASTVLLTRADKPLFSSSKIHRARVLSVSWLHHDLLLTHSAPALMKEHNTESKAMFLESGQLIVWRWLAIDRFFPPGSGEETRGNTLRGCASDYQESASFKTISTFSFPETATQYVTPSIHVYQSPTHDPVVLFVYPDSALISVLNVIHLQPRKPPPFPFDAEGEHLVETTEQMHLDDRRGSVQGSSFISRWEINVSSDNASVQTDDSPEMLMACAMGMGGQILVAVGARGTVWIWNERCV